MYSVDRRGMARHMMTASHFITWSLGKRFKKAVPLVYVVGYPKSGTTWACQLAAGYLQLPFPRFAMLPVGFPAVVHGHELVHKEYQSCVYVMRDGRDVMTSLYYHLQRVLLRGGYRRLPKNQRSIFLDAKDLESVRENFPRFLESQISRTIGCRHTWAKHVMSFCDSDHPRLACLKYECLLSDGASTLAHEMAKLNGKEPETSRAQFVLDDYSFARRSGRNPNEEDTTKFMRKGIAGDWKNHFTLEAAQIFDHYCGDALIATGYEPDRTWLDRLGASSEVSHKSPTEQLVASC